MNIFDDTIVGISTPLAKGAISIIRLSGNDAINITNKVFKGKNLNKVNSHTIHYGYIMNPENNDVLDEVLISVFKAPKTYTVEDVVEINCHGGVFVTNQIYNLLIEQGARPAEAGEFTKRAFLNGRIDLTEAEAVMDVIDAENKSFSKVANNALRGSVKNKIETLKEKILNIIAIINVNIDYPEYDDIEILTNDVILPKIKDIYNELIEILKYSKSAIYLKNGIDTVIIGKPNVGKSSILNALAKEEKAIVTNIPGTTRDTIEVKINLNNITLNLIDTAGIRDTNDIVEKIGVQKSIEKLEQAQLVLLILDGSRDLEEEDYNLLEQSKNKPRVILINKSDLPQKISADQIENAVVVSAYDVNSIDIIENAISKQIQLEGLENPNVTYISNARQIQKIKETKEALEEAIAEINMGEFIDLVELSLRKAWNSLGEITGEVNTDSLLDELFSKFCLGK